MNHKSCTFIVKVAAQGLKSPYLKAVLLQHYNVVDKYKHVATLEELEIL